MSTQVTLVNKATIIGTGVPAVVEAAMQPGVVPLPLTELFTIGVGLTSDVVTNAAGPPDVVTRTTILTLVPFVLPTATATRDQSGDAGRITGVTITNRGQQLVAIPIFSIIDASGDGTAEDPIPEVDATLIGTLRMRALGLVAGGMNYSATPVVTPIGGLMPGGTPAVITAVVALGVIQSFTIVSPGGPYFQPPSAIVITDTAGTGAQAALVADMELRDLTIAPGGNGKGYVTPIVVVTPRFKYTWPDSIGAAGQAKPFFSLIKNALQRSAGTPIVETPPAVA